MGWIRHSVAALLALVLSTVASAGTECLRVVAVGDLHGGYESFVTILRAAQLVDPELHWSDPDACLVQLGDVVDRGPDSRRLLDLLIGLRSEAPERVEVVLGNHEVLTLLGDLRYTTREEFSEFASEELPDDRQAAFERFLRSRSDDSAEADAAEEFARLFPPGWFARRKAFSPEGRYGAWLLERPLAVRWAGTLFLHAGLTVAQARQGPDRLVSRIREEIRSYLSSRRRLEQEGWITPEASYTESFYEVKHRLDALAEQGMTPPNGLTSVIGSFLAQLDASSVDPEGPLWYRGLALGDEAELSSDLAEILKLLDVGRIVVGHTTSDDHRIHRRFAGRVYVVDTGAGPAYGDRPAALEIEPDGSVVAIYPDERVRLAEPDLSDAVIEEALRNGTVMGIEEIGSGITRPRRVTLDYRGRRLRAAFKTVDIQETGMTRFAGSGTELNFTDNYRYERAAYLLDRELGMGMVPVTVLRKIDGVEGALIAWVEDAVSEADRREGALEIRDTLAFVRQESLMRLFDGLILNADRNLSNRLINRSDERLNLIDHSRSFRVVRKLPEGFDDETFSAPRSFVEALRELEPKSLRRLVEGTLSGVQIKALLARRDRIVEKLERDAEAYGDEIVFYDDP